MNRKPVFLAALAALAFLAGTLAASADVSETFDSDPILGGRAAVEGTNTSLSTALTQVDAFVYSSPGTLTQNACTNWRGGGSPDVSNWIADGSRLSWALGETIDQDDSFAFGARLKIGTDLFATGWAQICFGLTNSATTGMDRTGNTYPGDPFAPASPHYADNFDSIEWDFFPANTIDPTASDATGQQVVFGSEQPGDTQSFDRIAANFNAYLLQAPGRELGLPLDPAWLNIAVTYDAPTQTMSLSITDDGGTPLVDSIMAPDLVIPGYVGGFQVDQLSIMNYQDYWAYGVPSLLGTVVYDDVWFTRLADADPATAAEPASLAMLLLGLLGFARRRTRRDVTR